MKANKSLRVGIVGCGNIGQWHLRFWRKLDRISVVAVCDANKLRAETTAKSWHIPACYGDVGEMLKRESISVVDVCTPPQAHCPAIVQALESNCHVVVEKPLVMTTAEAKKILSAQTRSGARISVIHNIIFEPVMRKALSYIRKGDLGKIVNADVRIVAPPSDAMLSDRDHWCHSSPGGRFGEMLAHPIYILRAILGQMKVRSVHAAKIGSYPWVKFDELWVELEAPTSTGCIYASFNSVRDAWFIDIYGTKGMLKVNLVNQTLIKLKQRPITMLNRGLDSLQQSYQLFSSTAQNAALKLCGRWACGHEAYLRTFAQNMLNDRVAPVSLEEACDDVEVLEQLCRALESATWTGGHSSP